MGEGLDRMADLMGFDGSLHQTSAQFSFGDNRSRGIPTLQRNFSFGFRLDHEAVEGTSGVVGGSQENKGVKEGTESAGSSSAFMNSSGTTFKNDTTSGFVMSSLLLHRGEHYMAPGESAYSVGIDSVANHNRLLEKDCKDDDDSQLRGWGGSRLRDGLLSSFNWAVFSSP